MPFPGIDVSQIILYFLQTSRNVLLEKRQRKFDAELGSLQEERKAEAASREKLQKEIDSLKSFKYQLEEQIQVSEALTLSSIVLFFDPHVKLRCWDVTSFCIQQTWANNSTWYCYSLKTRRFGKYLLYMSVITLCTLDFMTIPLYNYYRQNENLSY